ncbi:hypothetical protein AQUCO_07800038v1 [Aquilegia coerulea]|uniref:PGG domain-containing protein n=1 Tax=Aquilegia coerulea TaxID=218851 RepID=A0A2G5C844_AQUCA|nr:hypothetical protein AQUCO_07800038v1 [Aquilegia coerulea]
MLELILELQPRQSMVHVGNNGWTALHYAVSKGFFNSVGDIVGSCPESSEVVDNEGQNFFQLAANFGDAKMVQHILGMRGIASSILNRQDNLGRTPLDVAALTGNESIISSLLEDPRVEKMLTKHLHWVVEKQNFVMMSVLMEANPGFFNEIDSTVLLNSRDENGDTILFKAVQENHLLLCKEIYKRCPSLIYHQSKGGRTALHDAAWRGEPKMLKFLITAGAKSYNEEEEEDIERGAGEKVPQKMLLSMVDEQGDTALHRAVLNHKLEAVKLLIEADKDIEYTTNTSGETPLMIAIREGQSKENKRDSGKIRKLLFKMLPNQTKERTGDKEWTLLQHAAQNGDLSMIEDIIQFCPSCLELVDNEGKNFLHIAAKWERVQVVKHVLRAKDIAVSVLNDEDYDGNTPLHIAALTGHEQMTLHFLYDPRVIKTTVNKEGQHVLHAINFSYDKRKAGVFNIADTVDQSDLKDQRDFDLVVGALIATVSFTAGITVPGGYISDGPNQGTAVLSKKGSFTAFIISNTFALIFSLYAVFSHFCARRLSEEADIIYQLNVATLCTLASIYCMMVAFITGSFAVLANSNWLAIVVCIISCLFFIFACRPIWKIAMQRKRSTPASQHKRST